LDGSFASEGGQGRTCRHQCFLSCRTVSMLPKLSFCPRPVECTPASTVTAGPVSVC
jgi:hypothetical protein